MQPQPPSAAAARNAAALVLLPALAACANLRGAPEPVVDVDAEVQEISGLHGPAAIRACLEKTGEVDRRACRDTIVEGRMIAIDARYTAFRQAFYAESRWGRFAITLASLGLTAAGSVSGADAARLLSAAATGLTGTRAAFDREVLVDKTANAIETAMDTARDAVALRIRQGLTQPAAAYPLAVALSDLEAYYNAGSLLGALSDITRLVGVQAEQVQAALRTANFGPTPSGLRIQAWVAPGGRRDLNRFQQLSRWLATHGGVPLQSLISSDSTDPQVEALRQAAIRQFQIP